jgi:hypothetical protein
MGASKYYNPMGLHGLLQGYLLLLRIRENVVGIAIAYGLDDRGV